MIGTNLSLALLSLLVLLTAATIFNATLKENADWFAAAVGRLPRASTVPLAGGIGWSSQIAAFRPFYPVLLLAFTAFIYSFLDPHFGFNNSSLVLLLALMVGLTLTTLLYEGGQILLSRRAFGMPAEFKAYPVAIVIAAVSVGLSRIVDLNPGVIIGFVAAATLSHEGTRRKELGVTVFVAMLSLMAMSLIAFALISPLRSLNEGQTGVWASLPETVAVAVFVGGAESILLALIPVTFTDGAKVWAWSRSAWVALALPAAFLFFHVILNRDGSFSKLDNAGAIAPLAASVVFLALVVVLWGFLRLRARSASPVVAD